jgi:hypothetical protein
MPNDTLSVYLQVHFIIAAYVLLIGAAGYASHAAIEFFKEFMCPTLRPATPLLAAPPEPLWYRAGWYRTAPQEFAPLFRNPHRDEWVYVHKGTVVHPTLAGVRRRGISDPPPLPE